MAAALLKIIHEYMINTNVQNQKWNKLLKVGCAGSSEPNPIGFKGMQVQMNLTPFASTQASLEVQVLYYTTFTSHHHPGRPQELRSHQSAPRVWKYQPAAPEACPH